MRFDYEYAFVKSLFITLIVLFVIIAIIAHIINK